MINDKDFIKIEYSGYDDKNEIFDSTSGEVAKSLHNREGPMLVVFGVDRLVPGMESALKEMKIGETRELVLSPQQAFGHRSKDMMRIMSDKEFYKSEIMPEVGLTVNMDLEDGTRLMGVIKSISGGRVLVDFNHPLADKTIRYNIKLVEVITKTYDKIDALFADMEIKAGIKLSEKEDSLEITVTEKPKDYEQKNNYLRGIISVLFPSIKEIKFHDDEKKEAKK